MKKITGLLILLMALVACNSKKAGEPPISFLADGGLFVLNQGNFTYANASLSYYNPADQSTMPSVFHQVNGVPLGDVAQSLSVFEDKVYLVINNSGLIYIIDRHSGEFITKITGFESPRQLLVLNSDKAYVSDLYANYISVLSLATNEITDKIQLGRSSEAMVLAAGKVFVAHWSEYNQTRENNMVMVIDPETDQLVDSIQVGKEPNSMVEDGGGKVWVLCSGGYLNLENPSLWQIDPVTKQVIQSFYYQEKQSNPVGLSYDVLNQSLLFLNGDVFSMSTSDADLPSNVFIESGDRNFYALFVHPDNGDIYLSDAGNYLSNGMVYRYNANGLETDYFDAGIIPGFFGLNR